jgi:hypothetical protein
MDKLGRLTRERDVDEIGRAGIDAAADRER